MRRLLVKFLNFVDAAINFNKKLFAISHNVEKVDEEIGIEEALTKTLEHEEEINREFIGPCEVVDDEIPFSDVDFEEENYFTEEKEVCVDLEISKEIEDKLIREEFRRIKSVMSKKEFKHFKRAYNRNKLYIKLKKLGRKL